MFRWLGNLFKKRKPTIHDYGRYLHKPVMSRALCMILNINEAELTSRIANKALKLIVNGQPIRLENLGERLSVGDYKISYYDKKNLRKIYKFHIL